MAADQPNFSTMNGMGKPEKKHDTDFQFEDKLFDYLRERSEDEHISVGKYFDLLHTCGLRDSDPRLKDINSKLSKQGEPKQKEPKAANIDRETFKKCLMNNSLLIAKAFKNQFVIPDFANFCQHIEEMYEKCLPITSGKIYTPGEVMNGEREISVEYNIAPANVAEYIPQLAKFSHENWGVSVCTIDGQRYSKGHTTEPFCIQSCTKPLMYALACKQLGAAKVHQHVGQEPSGRGFNEIKLNPNKRPHNPMINSGAITVTSLLKHEDKLSERYDWLFKQYQRLAGGESVGFSNSTFLSERETADRNFAIAYYLKEYGCFPEGTNLSETLDFYFQACSIDITCESGSVIAATLANGGICPLTDDRVLDELSVQNTLSLMHSCGMYDFSGQFAFSVGLPAKSGVSGCILLVVPNTMGICLWSPPLDKHGNSCRGIEFCQELVRRFNFHNYDILQRLTSKKMDPRLRKIDATGSEITSLLFGAFNGDLSAMRRFFLKGINMGQGDYDCRTALHLAAAEGHVEVVRFLLDKCHVDPEPKDRWGHTPLTEAREFGHKEVEQLILEFSKSGKYTPKWKAVIESDIIHGTQNSTKKVKA